MIIVLLVWVPMSAPASLGLCGSRVLFTICVSPHPLVASPSCSPPGGVGLPFLILDLACSGGIGVCL